MNGHFTSEIGRMRVSEMISRGEHYQKVALLKRAEKAERPVHHRRVKVARRRLLIATALSALFSALLSTAAMAYPLTTGHGTESRAVSGAGQVLQHTAPTATTTFSFTWAIVGAAAAAVIVLGIMAAKQMGKLAHAS
jgi:xanthine/uracil/vitamin C permease (AzgA family)